MTELAAIPAIGVSGVPSLSHASHGLSVHTLAADTPDVMFIATLIVALILLITMVIMLHLNNRSLKQVMQTAERLAKGDLSQRVRVSGPLQVARLGEALNRMANQLDDRLGTVVGQRNELQAVLASMTEGLLAVDSQQKLLNMNRAAAELLGLDASRALGRDILEVVRNHALETFISSALKGDGSVEGNIVFRQHDARTGTDTERHFHVQGAALRDGVGGRIGAVIVLHDETRLRRLESVRQDFVANASHEMRTPVAAIKAAIETVLTDQETQDPQDTQRFLKMIDRQAQRLQAIIEDMLALARIEQDSHESKIELEMRALGPVLSASTQTCQAKSEQKQIGVSIDCDPGLRARIHSAMVEQAIVNLIDNAIKFSPPQSTVSVSARRDGDEVILAVKDHGPGIEPEHLPRLFERFYRTDKARSRALGGTGLGLAIVKHISHAHGGRVSVDSSPGRGSTFRIHLPTRTDDAHDSGEARKQNAA